MTDAASGGIPATADDVAGADDVGTDAAGIDARDDVDAGVAVHAVGDDAVGDDAVGDAMSLAEPPASAPPADAEAPLGTFVVVEVVNVTFELPSPHPVIHLLEQESPFRGLDFPIGLPEAQSIALALEHEASPRPTTHDVMVAVMAVAGCEVVAVRLTGERGGTILAELDVMGPKGHEVLDCRPSDGIAVALRLAVPAPILCEAALLDR